MFLSEEINNEMALKAVIEDFKKEKDTVEIKNSTRRNGKTRIDIKIGTKSFFSEGETNDETVRKITGKIQNHKPTFLKRKFGKVVSKVFKNRF